MYENYANTIIKAQNGDKDAMAKLVEENQGLIWSIVKRFTRKRIRNRRYLSNRMFGFYKIN